MATRQYIGARYVPKFYQNSVDGSAQWEANVVYDPLTYVTLTNGHMYISKKQVPATVGSPVSNVDYWLDVANYNGFISTLQDEIDDINDVKIPAINYALSGLLGTRRRVIVIADSYGLTGGANSFTNKLKARLNLSGDNYYDLSEGSLGFSHIGNAGHNAVTLLQANANTITNHDTITDIIVTCGLNDSAHEEDYNSLITYAGLFYDYAASEYPNAKIHYGFVGNKLSSTYTDANVRYWMLSSIDKLYDFFDGVGADVMHGVEYVLHDARNMDSTDFTHPNTYGSQYLADFIYQWIENGYCKYKAYARVPIGSSYIDVLIDGGVTTLNVRIASTSGTAAQDGVDLLTFPATSPIWGPHVNPAYKLFIGRDNDVLGPQLYYIQDGKLTMNIASGHTYSVNTFFTDTYSTLEI